MCWSRVGLALGLALMLTTAVAVEPEPQPIYIESDSLKIDETKGVSVYQGRVIFRQGPDSLQADKLVIYAEQRQQIKKIVATGKPARFDHQAELAEERSWGEAEKVVYEAQSSRVVLSGEARFQQGDNQFSGNLIEYDAEKKLVKAGKSGGGEGRVQIVIHPRKKTD
ncbi:MAG TPA: lipopolysaccharide transport periplasmic protein LptA, partial [Candidatus Tenderia electrophaga]|nr:lipopolysaccharide transport periplasmic protein LptA [Candidatus Tenderia electrophaga]